MDYVHDPRTFLYSHYVSRGVRTATGVIGLTLLALLAMDLQGAMVVSIGALCTSQMDLPSPLRHKFNELLACVLLTTLVTFIVAVATPYAVLPAVIVVVSFLAGLMAVYGNKTLSLQFAALFVMTLTFTEEFALREALEHTAQFFLGAAGYMAFAMAVAWSQRRRIKEQVLAECLYELAVYVERKAGFYDTALDFDAQFNALVRQQISVADKQQVARDFVFRDNRGASDGRLVQIHMRMLDLYEYLLSTNTDYPLLRQWLADADIMRLLRDIIERMRLDLEVLAYAVGRDQPSPTPMSYDKEMAAIDAAVDELEHGHHAIPLEAIAALEESVATVRGAIRLMAQLHAATATQVELSSVLLRPDMTPFLTRQKYELSLVLEAFNWRSPVLRFALRTAMAVAAGLWIANHLPYASHGYWVLLTIVVILKPTFSMTRQRNVDRVLGTLVGCVIAAVLLRYVHSTWLLLGALYLSTAASAAFVTVRYRYTAAAAAVQVLIQINLLLPGSKGAIGERLVDTLIGAAIAIATAFSYVLPAWEYRNLPKLVDDVLRTNRRFIESARDLLLGSLKDDFAYRVQRKQFMDTLTGLIAAFARMLDEPKSRHRAVDNLNRFIVQNYLVAAHVAAVRILVRQRAQELDEADTRALIGQTVEAALESLARAKERFDQAIHEGGWGVRPRDTQELGAADFADQSARSRMIDAATHPDSLSAMHLLERRLQALRADTAKIALRCGALGRALRLVD
ncbi:FUSC family protein [Ralstonia solanacearum]|uniref:FUSC family protein n=1 Tax=Ralstonia solanacearum TaxID=305 RepID=UPI0005C46115|nr:FUSC family protein [Ralstonia solanacearum]MBB6590221.1 FUSC family protein [Ralstonia solanacearum]MBB6594419.1 FUSC family protein [Ralstonia solanacearum]MDB0541643.1 FUSC family protein [Ralstonia solanacearum]MDB0551845.1 FUSC family protein [Ralstonia solanacearum]MDB0556579.1 FUSC family protein [Ralstonia solanacearum]